MLVHPWDAPLDPDEWRRFVVAQGFGQLIAAGRDRDVAVVVPTQYVLANAGPGEEADPASDTVWLHLARPNPVWVAIEENPLVVLAVAGDWAYIPSAWKAVGDEDPALGIPTTYYAAAQLRCSATIVDDPEGKLEILRRQLATCEPDLGAVDPSAHLRRLPGIRGLQLTVHEVTAKFKYGGNVDVEHREAVARRLAERGLAGDAEAREHLDRRSGYPAQPV